VTKPRKSPEQLGRMLWDALRSEKPEGYRDCAIEVVRAKTGSADWDARLIAKGETVNGDLKRVFAQAKSKLQEQYGFLDD
jgi:hypothetical protein